MSTRFAEVEPEPSELEAGPTFFPFTKKGESHEKDGDNCWPFGDGLAGDDVCRRGSGTEGRAAPGSRVCDRDGEPRLQPDRWESKRTVRQSICKIRQCGDQLFRHWAPKFHKLPGDRGRVELRCARRQLPRLP